MSKRTYFGPKKERNKELDKLRSKFRRLLDRAANLRELLNNPNTNELDKIVIQAEWLSIKNSIATIELELKHYEGNR